MVHDNCIDTIPGMRLSEPTTASLTWRGWFQEGKRLAAAEFMRAWATVKVWHRRARGRSELAYLDDHMLEDIGMTPEQANRETLKPFWRA